MAELEDPVAAPALELLCEKAAHRVGVRAGTADCMRAWYCCENRLMS